jgi:general secretion pathway protein F
VLTVLNLSGLSVRSSQDQHVLGLVMDRLALAVASGLPLASALRSLLSDPELAGGARRAAAWRKRLTLVVGEIEAGRTLSYACERHLAAFLPPHFVPALRCAEEADYVARALPLLVRNLDASIRARQSLRGACVYPLVQFAVVMAVLTGVFVFIVPKLAQVRDELAPGPEGDRFLGWLWFPSVLARHAGLLVLVGLAVVVCFLVVRWFVRRTVRGRRVMESVCRALPVLGGLWRRFGLVEGAGAVAGFLAAGADLGQAARWAAASVRTEWARSRLTRFAGAVEAGDPWADAWAQQATASPLCEWLVRNAAAREAPREGFQAVAEWALDDLNRRLRRLARWAEPALLLGNAALVALVVFTLVGALFGTVYAELGI